MPFPLLAHQAPVLPLKAWRPAAFNATALVIGSMAPDLQNFWNDPHRSVEFGHTFAGQFTFCLPVTMAVVLLVGNLRLGEVLAARLGKRLAWLSDAATDVTQPGGVARAAASALCGSFSHLAFDALTHVMLPGWMPHTVFHVAHLRFTTHTLTQVGASIVGGVIALWVLRRLSLQSTQEPPARRGGGFLLVPFALAGGAVGVVRSLPALRHPDWYFEAGRVYVWGYTLFLVVAGAAAGVLVAATLLAWWDHRVKVRAARAAQPTQP